MATSNLPNLVRMEVSNRQRRAKLDRQISKLIWVMENNPLANLAYLSTKVDKLRLQVRDLDAAIDAHVWAAERRQLRRELLAQSS